MGKADAAGPLGAASSPAALVLETARRAPVADSVLGAAVDRLRHRLGNRLMSLDAGLGWEGANGQPLQS